MTWGDGPRRPLPAGLDLFEKLQKPDVRATDDLSRFVMARIRDAESEPKLEVPQVYNQPAGPMAHRYATGVRRDCVAFRRIVALYVEAVAAINDVEPGEREAKEDQALGLQLAVAVVAARWDDHPDYRDEWRL